jgi:hypothetical protein
VDIANVVFSGLDAVNVVTSDNVADTTYGSSILDSIIAARLGLMYVLVDGLVK